MTDITQESATLATMLNHRGQVSALLRGLARQLEARADYHDLTKFRPDEFAGFVEINRIAREHPYGSPEYKASLKDNHTIDLHFSRNSHHPEYHSDGVNGMTLIDFIEMVFDWVAATSTYGNTRWEDVIKTQKERFGLTDCQLDLIALILEET